MDGLSVPVHLACALFVSHRSHFADVWLSARGCTHSQVSVCGRVSAQYHDVFACLCLCAVGRHARHCVMACADSSRRRDGGPGPVAHRDPTCDEATSAYRRASRVVRGSARLRSLGSRLVSLLDISRRLAKRLGTMNEFLDQFIRRHIRPRPHPPRRRHGGIRISDQAVNTTSPGWQ